VDRDAVARSAQALVAALRVGDARLSRRAMAQLTRQIAGPA